MKSIEALREQSEKLGPWRYDHHAGELVIRGDPAAAPIHGSHGRGADIMKHILSVLAAKHDLSKWRAIDLGCLEGHYTELLCEAGIGQVVAVDLSSEHVARARFLLHEVRNFENVEVIEGSVEDEQLLATLGRFDLILFHGLLYHLQDPLGMFRRLRDLGKDEHFVLLGTQFKFTYAEVIAPSPLANVKFRKIQADADGKVRYEGTRSTYAPLAMRLNPMGIFRLLNHFGYADSIHYDTPLGATYGLQLSIIVSTSPVADLVGRLNRGHAIPSLRFAVYTGNMIDGINFEKDWRSRVARFIVRAAYSIAERLGQSENRQLRRRLISRYQS
jgi:SAM-dependent methyltransferase